MFIKTFFKKKIPTFRHKTYINLVDKHFLSIPNSNNKKKYLITKNLIKRKKIFYSNHNPVISYKNIKKYNFVVTDVHYDVKPFKAYYTCQNIYDMIITIPNINFLNIGDIFKSYKYIADDIFKNKFLGAFLCVDNIPLSVNMCYVRNMHDNKFTYAKASGTYCKKIKNIKKSKLLLLKLPSNKDLIILKYSFAFIGQGLDFLKNKLVEGKWGFSLKKTKKISVRGVAMNPVDHPNGGRTKTVQPEKSPWGWVAKKNK